MLPVEAAKDLAKDMAAKGISGKIEMKEPIGSSGSKDSEAPEKDLPIDPDIEAISGDIISAIDKGDKVGLARFLMELVERISSKEEGPPSLG